MKFRWESTERDNFDKAVELLLERRHEKARTTFAPDGRGGDEGIDFLVQGRTLTIYQLKHYLDGLKSSATSRKRAIKDSFETAVTKRSPRTWILVVPAKLTVPEQKYVKDLKAPKGCTQPHIRVLDLPKLELLLSKYPDIRAHLDREPLFDAIEERQIEVAEPRDITEVLERAQALAGRGGNLDPDWDIDLFVRNGIATALPRPKHDKAMEKSPLGLSFTVDLAQVSSDVRATIERSLGYGSGEAITIPAEAIANLSTTGGPQWQWFAGDNDIVLEPISPEVPDAMLRLLLTGPDGDPLGEHEGPITYIAPGALGHTLTARFYTGLTMELRLPADPSTPGQIDLTVSVHRLFPADVRDCLALYRLLSTPGVTVEAFIEGQDVFRGIMNGEVADERDERRAVLEQFADHLEILQRHARLRRALPVEISGLDRATAAAAVLVLEGKCTYLPDPITFKAVIDTNGEQQWIDQLRDSLMRPHAMIARLANLTLDVAGLPVSIGPVGLYSPSVSIKNADQLLSLLDRGAVDGQRITYVADEHSGWRIVPLLEPGVSLNWEPAPWSLVGIDEHVALAGGSVVDPAPTIVVESPQAVRTRVVRGAQSS